MAARKAAKMWAEKEVFSGRCRVIGISMVRGAWKNQQAQRTARCLGLTKMHKIVFHKNIKPIRGMINRIKHMVDVFPVPESDVLIPLHKLEQPTIATVNSNNINSNSLIFGDSSHSSSSLPSK